MDVFAWRETLLTGKIAFLGTKASSTQFILLILSMFHALYPQIFKQSF